MAITQSDVVLHKGPCPKCGSKDNNVTYDDGHEHCFTAGCGHWKKPTEDAIAPMPGGAKRGPSALLDPSAYANPFRDLDKRGLTKETLRRYGYFLAKLSGSDVQVAPYYSQAGELVNQKIRDAKKDFAVLKAEGAPPMGECRLFGHHVYGDRFDKQVVITEGELDALSVAQVKDFRVAVVSLMRGAGTAAKDLKANYLWLDRFQDIVLWFDDDEAGRQATEECAKLFKVGKVRVAKVAGRKDASDCLQAKQPGEITEAIFSAQAWRPKGMVNAADAAKDVLAPKHGECVTFEYPPFMAKLQEMSGGMHVGEVTYHVAGTGVGKSTQLREIQYDLVMRQGVKIAVLSFEDTRRDMQVGLMSIHADERLQLRPLPDLSDVQAVAAYDLEMTGLHTEVFGMRLVELFDPETAEWGMESILGYVRYAAKALDCMVVFIDPLSFIIAGLDAVNQTTLLDRVAMELAKLAKELGICIQISHHLRRVSQGSPHEEGAPTSLNELRSSGSLANFAVFVVGWERNNQADGEGWRVTQGRVLKQHRLVGKSGLADILFYGENGRLVRSHLPFPPIGKPEEGTDGGQVKRGEGFGPVSEY